MSKTIQFRCPSDKRHLFSWEVGKEELSFKVEGLQTKDIEGSNKKYVICTKCDRTLEIHKGELREAAIIEV